MTNPEHMLFESLLTKPGSRSVHISLPAMLGLRSVRTKDDSVTSLFDSNILQRLIPRFSDVSWAFHVSMRAFLYCNHAIVQCGRRSYHL